MICKKCGNEILEGEKFCGKCGNKVIRKTKIKIFIVIFAIIISIVVGNLGILYFYGKDIKVGKITINNPIPNLGITNRYLTNNFKESGFDQFDDVDVKILAITDIEYNNFSKLVLANATTTLNGEKHSSVGLLLVNRKENIVDSFTINNNIIWILNGINSNSRQNQKEVLEICAQYIQNYGTDFLENIEDDNFKKITKDISNIVGLEQARQYVKNGMTKNTNTNLEYKILFEKGSALAKYVAFYTEGLQYNSRYPIDERTYKYLEKDYSNKSTLNAFEYVYGPAYTFIKQYEIYSISDSSKLIGSYNNLETAKNKLEVEE